MAHGITREYRFEAAHMLVGHPRCSRMHGHSYRLLVHLRTPTQLADREDHYWVIDFGDVDTIVKPLVESLDHHFILTGAEELGERGGWSYRGTTDVTLIDALESTAEAIAQWFGEEIDRALNGTDIWVKRIELWETARNCAIWTPVRSTRLTS